MNDNYLSNRDTVKSAKKFWLPICFQDELGCTRMVSVNWDFVAILEFSQSGRNQRLWDRSVTVLSQAPLAALG